MSLKKQNNYMRRKSYINVKKSEPKKFSTLIDELIPQYHNNENDIEDDGLNDESEQQELDFIKKQPQILMNKKNNSKANKMRNKCYFNFNLRSLLLDYQDEIRIIFMTFIFVMLTNQSLLTILNSYVPFFFETTSSICYNLYGRVFVGILFAIMYAFMWLK